MQRHVGDIRPAHNDTPGDCTYKFSHHTLTSTCEPMIHTFIYAIPSYVSLRLSRAPITKATTSTTASVTGRRGEVSEYGIVVGVSSSLHISFGPFQERLRIAIGMYLGPFPPFAPPKNWQVITDFYATNRLILTPDLDKRNQHIKIY